MKQIVNIAKWVLILGATFITLLLIGIESFDRYISTNAGTRYIYRKTPYAETLEIHKTESGIRYITLGNQNKPNLLLLHGAPGSVFDWVKIASDERLYSNYRLVIAERPGYGGTTPRKVEQSILRQAERISEVLEKEGKATVLAHSYGGPVAMVLSAIRPNLVNHAIGAAGQYNPNDEVVFKISHYIKSPLFQFILPRWIWASNEEKLSHKKAQDDVFSYYAKITCPVSLIHGDSDTLVPYHNSVFLMNQLTTEKKKLITLFGENHPFHMRKPSILVNFLLESNLNPQEIDIHL